MIVPMLAVRPAAAVSGGIVQPGLRLILKPDTLSLNNGDEAVGLQDVSGYNNHPFVQGHPAPIFVADAQNGLPILRFGSPGAATGYRLPDFMSEWSAGTIFMVVKLAADPPHDSRFGGIWQMSSSGSVSHFPFSDGVVYESWGTTVRKTLGNPATPLNQWNIYCITSAPNSWTAYLNNVSIFSTTTNTVGWSSAPTLGYELISGFTHFLVADVGDVYIYDSALSSTDRTATHNLLKTRWNTP